MKVIFSILFFISFAGRTQNIILDSLRIISAECRVSLTQPGFGMLVYYTSGTNPPYLFEIENLENDFSYSHTVNHDDHVVGLNGYGVYVINITDNLNQIYIDSILVDSTKPEANFLIDSNELMFSNGKYIGFGETNADFIRINGSIVEQGWEPIIPNCFFSWNLDSNILDWDSTYYNFQDTIINHTYTIGNHTTCLVKHSQNDCRDTLCYDIEIYMPKDSVDGFLFNVIPKQSTQTVLVNHSKLDKDIRFKIFSSTGQLLYDESLEGLQTEIPFYHARGVYLYQFYQEDSMQKLGAGKFVF